uniref:Uncharacterized protein n=1 Tax=Clastoptera arizonana TaxID=38151 RepID=A0A1B6DDZ1_9HEMI
MRSYNCKRFGYKPTVWIFLVVYFLQLGFVTAVLPFIPDSDATVINNSTSTLNGSTLLNTDPEAKGNLDVHISDYNPKDKSLPKKVQSGTGSKLKQALEEKLNLMTSNKNKAEATTNPTEALKPNEFSPKVFPEEEALSGKESVINDIIAKKHLLNAKLKSTANNSTNIHINTQNISVTEIPPKVLPTGSISVNNITIPLIINHDHENSSHIPAIFPKDNSTGPVYQINKTSEAFDMTHSNKYLGQFDTDDVKHIAEKLNKTKNNTLLIVNPKSQVDISGDMDKNGPKLLPESKKPSDISGVISSSSNVLAISSAVLSSKNEKSEGLLQPIKTIAATVMTIVGMTILGMAGFLLWRRIVQRRFGHREMLINEDDFEEVSDLHHFEGTLPTPHIVN